MQQIKRVIAILLCIIIVAAPILSYVYIIKETNHECIDESCPLCLQINYMVQIIQQYHSFTSKVSFVMALLCISTIVLCSYRKFRQTTKTLINLKVELLD